MEIKITYIAEDGTEFFDKKECLEYEKKKRLRIEVFKKHIKAFDSNGKPLDTGSKDWYPKALTIQFETKEAMHAFAELLRDGEEEEIDAFDPSLGLYLLGKNEPITIRYIEWLHHTIGTAELNEGWYDVKAMIDLLVPDYVKNLWPTENKHE